MFNKRSISWSLFAGVALALMALTLAARGILWRHQLRLRIHGRGL